MGPIRNQKGLLWYKLNINSLPFYVRINQIDSPLFIELQQSQAVIGQKNTALMTDSLLEVGWRGWGGGVWSHTRGF